MKLTKGTIQNDNELDDMWIWTHAHASFGWLFNGRYFIYLEHCKILFHQTLPLGVEITVLFFTTTHSNSNKRKVYGIILHKLSLNIFIHNCAIFFISTQQLLAQFPHHLASQDHNRYSLRHFTISIIYEYLKWMRCNACFLEFTIL